ELALGVLAERGDVQPGVAPQVDQLAVDDRLAVLLAEAPDPAGLVVAIDVHADQLGQRLAAVDVAPGDALAVVLAGPGRGVRVLADGGVSLRGRLGFRPPWGLERVQAFLDPPAVVTAVLDDVDHLPEVLADVARPEGAGLAVEGELPDVPQADRVDLAGP